MAARIALVVLLLVTTPMMYIKDVLLMMVYRITPNSLMLHISRIIRTPNLSITMEPISRIMLPTNPSMRHSIPRAHITPAMLLLSHSVSSTLKTLIGDTLLEGNDYISWSGLSSPSLHLIPFLVHIFLSDCVVYVYNMITYNTH